MPATATTSSNAASHKLIAAISITESVTTAGSFCVRRRQEKSIIKLLGIAAFLMGSNTVEGIAGALELLVVLMGRAVMMAVGQVELIDGEVKVVVAAGRRFKLLVEEVLFQLKQKRRMLVLIATDRWQACWRYFTISEDKLSSSAECIYNTTDNGFQAILNAAHWSSCAWEGGSKIVIYRATFSY